LIRDTGVTGPIIDKLRIMCGKPGPVFRPSLKFVFYFLPDIFETTINDENSLVE
jgi:hypothetical protein